MRIYHDSRNATYRDPRGAAPAGSRILIKADVRECRVESVKIPAVTIPNIDAESELSKIMSKIR
jgi:hypothetical protein